MTAQGRSPEPQLESILEFETLISNTSASLFAAPPGNIDSTVERCLERVRKFFQADRCVLLSVSSDKMVVKMGLASYGEGIPRVSPEINLVEYFPWSRHRLLVERAPIRVSRIADLPPEAGVEIDSWNQMQIRSALTLPIESNGIINHMILLNSVHRECVWPDAFVTRLRVLGEMLAGAMERQEMINRCHESEKRLKMAADLAEAGLWSVDTHTRKLWGTERLRELFGLPPGNDITLESLMSTIHPDDSALVWGTMDRLNRDSGLFNLEYRIIRPADGAERWLRSRGRPYFGSLGDAESVMGVSIDITEQKNIEIALRASEHRLARGAHLAGLAFYEVDFQEGTFYVDPALKDLCGLPSEREQGLGALEFWMEQLHPEDRARVMHLRQELHRGSMDQVTLEYRFQNPVVGEIWIQHLAGVSMRGVDGVAVATFGVLRDITNLKKAEDKLRQLSRRLINAHEDERALLARELHDDLTQRMAVLAIDVGRAESAEGNAACSDTLRGVREELVLLSENVHALAYHLHPSVLTELGLVEALRTESDRRMRHSQVKVSLDLDPPPACLRKEEALCLFRVAQESLNNVVRHAGKAAATMTLREKDGGLLLTVDDRGAGFDRELLDNGQHLGMVSMRERLELVNGTLGIRSAPGQGTTISAWVPMQEESS